MLITRELLEKGISRRGSWNYQQLKALGLPEAYFEKGNLIRGWKWYLLGRQVSENNVKEFLRLKDKGQLYLI